MAWIWRSGRDRELKAALLVIATLLASPHTLDYDLTMLGPAIAFVVPASIANGFRDCDIGLLAAAWIAPLLARGLAGATGVPLGLFAILALFALVMRRATGASPVRLESRKRDLKCGVVLARVAA